MGAKVQELMVDGLMNATIATGEWMAVPDDHIEMSLLYKIVKTSTPTNVTVTVQYEHEGIIYTEKSSPFAAKTFTATANDAYSGGKVGGTRVRVILSGTLCTGAEYFTVSVTMRTS